MQPPWIRPVTTGSKALFPAPRSSRCFGRRFFGLAILYLVVALDFSGSLASVAAGEPVGQPGGMRKCVRTVLAGKEISPNRTGGAEIARAQVFRDPA